VVASEDNAGRVYAAFREFGAYDRKLMTIDGVGPVANGFLSGSEVIS